MDKALCCVLIPSLSPDRRLPEYVRELLDAGFGGVVVVNDGSAPEYDVFFDEVRAMNGSTVLSYPVNKGKGGALKTGYEYIEDETSFRGIITADSDGQHLVGDTLNLASLLKEDRDEVLLGSRDFSKNSTQVPPKSRSGNRITSAVFHALYGPKLPDTQTGLRAFRRELLPFMRGIRGERFEYEMNVLMRCAREKIPMTPVGIHTVYHDENKGTHFHPIRDSWRIYKLLLGDFIRFSASSVLCVLIDLFLFWLLDSLILPGMLKQGASLTFFGASVTLKALIATFAARIVSATVNYNLNKTFVFQIRQCKGAVWRYIILCVCVALVSGSAVSLLERAFPAVNGLIFKMPVDLILFFANYRLQRAWVFGGKDRETA